MVCSLLSLKAIMLSEGFESRRASLRIKLLSEPDDLTLMPAVSKIEPKRNWVKTHDG